MTAPVAASLDVLGGISNIDSVDFNGGRGDAEGKSRHDEEPKLHIDCLTVLQVTSKAKKRWDKRVWYVQENYIRDQSCLRSMRQEDFS